MLKLNRGYEKQAVSPLIVKSARQRGSVIQLHHHHHHRVIVKCFCMSTLSSFLQTMLMHLSITLTYVGFNI